jgi:hypothetical protein
LAYGFYLEQLIARIFEGVRLDPECAVGNGVEGQALEHLLDVDDTVGCLINKFKLKIG